MLTLEEQKRITEADRFYHKTLKKRDGTPVTARRNGQTKTWKRDPTAFEIPIKVGLRGFGYINATNAHEWIV